MKQLADHPGDPHTEWKNIPRKDPRPNEVQMPEPRIPGHGGIPDCDTRNLLAEHLRDSDSRVARRSLHNQEGSPSRGEEAKHKTSRNGLVASRQTI